MSHASEDELVLLYYGDGGVSPAVEAHLAECPACADAFAALRADLSSITEDPVPARGEDYGPRVWSRLRPRLGSRR